MFCSYGNKICQASYRVAREENNMSIQTAGKHQINLKLRGFCCIGKTSFQFIVR